MRKNFQLDFFVFFFFYNRRSRFSILVFAFIQLQCTFLIFYLKSNSVELILFWLISIFSFLWYFFCLATNSNRIAIPFNQIGNINENDLQSKKICTIYVILRRNSLLLLYYYRGYLQESNFAD